MLAHRFREFPEPTSLYPAATCVGAGVNSAFVLCPCAVAPAFQLQAAFLYRVAFEQAQAEVARERRARWTAFSLN